jgi:hypothetical protein
MRCRKFEEPQLLFEHKFIVLGRRDVVKSKPLNIRRNKIINITLFFYWI